MNPRAEPFVVRLRLAMGCSPREAVALVRRVARVAAGYTPWESPLHVGAMLGRDAEGEQLAEAFVRARMRQHQLLGGMGERVPVLVVDGHDVDVESARPPPDVATTVRGGLHLGAAAQPREPVALADDDQGDVVEVVLLDTAPRRGDVDR